MDVGCGNGRIIPDIVYLVEQYTGIDTDSEYLKTAKEISRNYENVMIMRLDAEQISKKFKNNSFAKTICLWSTIGCFKNDGKAMKEIAKVTRDKLFFTIITKGTLEKRKEYYEKLGIKYAIDRKSETIKSPQWGMVKAYSKEDLVKLIHNTGLKIDNLALIEGLAHAVTCSKTL